MTQAELALRLGVSRRTVRAMESGAYAPSVTLACRVARELGHPVEAVFQT
ncbi:MAG: helix-turn-helix domain-containing protein [Brevundimonas sp.]|nr:MAG: helix-turn-helix domain-containing protein [Brevundimonas sp.]